MHFSARPSIDLRQTVSLRHILLSCLAFALFSLMVSTVRAESAEKPEASEGPNAALTAKSTISGTVVDSHGNPVAGATVGVSRTFEADGAILIHGRLRHPTTTGPDGTFEIKGSSREGFDGDKVELTARKDGYQSASSGETPLGTTGLKLTLSRRGTLSGSVLEKDGSPVAGAEVRILPYDPSGGGYYNMNVIDTVKSDEKGRWRSSALDPGAYSVYAVDGEDRSDPIQKVAISPGEDTSATGLRIVRDKYRVAGRVVDKQSRVGIPGGQISLSHQMGGLGPNFSETAGPDGEFLFGKVPPGEYRLSVRDVPGYTRSRFSAPVNLDISVASADVGDVTIELQRPATVMGRVFLPSGEPAEGAVVQPRGRRLRGYYEDVVCDQLGIFQVADLEPGVEFHLVADLEDYPPALSSPMTLEAGETRDDVEMHFETGVSISGRVVYDDGVPVTEGYTVDALSANHDRFYGRSNLDASGAYEIRGVAPGATMLQLNRNNPDSPFGREISSKRKALIVRRDEDLTGVDFTLSRPKELPGFIAGRVTAPDGKGVAGVTVVAFARRKRGEEPDEQGDRGEAITGNNGEFRIENLHEGPFVLWLHAMRGPSDVPYVLEREQDDEIEVVSPTDEVRIPLKRYVSVSGKVVDKDSGEPVKSYEIRVLSYYQQGRSATTINDPGGEFRLERVAPLPADLFVRVKDRSMASVPLEFPDDEDLTGIVVELPAKTGIEGTVIAQRDGSPVEGARVQVYWGDDMSDTTGRDGKFSVSGVPSGACKLTVDHPEFGWTLASPVEVPEGEMVSGVVIELATPGQIEGHVYFPEGEPIEGIEVTLDFPTGSSGETRTADTDRDGFYEFPRLAPGGYRVQLRTRSTAGNVGPTEWVLLKPGRNRVVDFGGPGCVVRGTVTRGGTPVADAEVRLIRGTQRTLGCISLYQMTGEDGAFLFTGLEPGEYQLVLLGPFPTSPLVMKEIDVERDELRVDLEYPTGSISGRALQAGSGEAVPHAPVKAVWKDLDRSFVGAWKGDYFSGLTDEDGNYRIEWLPPGDYAVQVSSPPLGWGIQPVSLEEGEHAEDVDFTLDKGGDLLITLVDAVSGESVDGSVKILDPAGREIGIFDAGHGHSIEALGISPGQYRVLACPSWYASHIYGPSLHTLKVEAGTNREYELPCPRGCLAKLLLLDPDGEPVSGVDLAILDAEGNNRAVPPYNPAFVFPWNTYRLEPGDYSVSVRKEGFEPVDTTLVVPLDTLDMEKTIELSPSPD